jgi:hypothetical protein
MKWKTVMIDKSAINFHNTGNQAGYIKLRLIGKPDSGDA